ncbi:MAG: tetratricopeptide repeat protein [Sphingomicrobium sp.]
MTRSGKTMRLKMYLLAAAVAATTLTPANAQRRQPTPDERIERLEKQVNQVQRRVYGKQPVDTAGYTLDPAVTQSDLTNVTARLDSIERQMADLVRTSEENSNRVATMEAELFRLKAEAERRPPPVEATESDPQSTANRDDVAAGPAPRPGPKYENRANDDPPPVIRPVPRGDSNFAAAGEEAYDVGYQLWTQKKYDQAITALRAMASSFPGHRRVSWANNLAGRALLDKGQYRAAAEALLANYRADPRGERAADSLYYLGQASAKLGQPSQACKAYSELENVYGATMRSEIARLLPAAKSQAKCG